MVPHKLKPYTLELGVRALFRPLQIIVSLNCFILKYMLESSPFLLYTATFCLGNAGGDFVLCTLMCHFDMKHERVNILTSVVAHALMYKMVLCSVVSFSGRGSCFKHVLVILLCM